MSIQGDKNNLGLVLSGQPILIKSANVFVTQPKIKDIVLFGEEDFLVAIQMLTKMEQFTDMVKQGNFNLELISDFQLLMMIIDQDPTVKSLMMNLFSLIFPDYEINITEDSVDFFVTEEEQQRLVGKFHAFNFVEFQNVLSDAFLPQGDNEREPDYKPINDMAKKIADKIKAGREKVHAMQTAEAGGPHSIFCDYCSILAVGMDMDVNIFFNYTPFQLYDSYRRYFEKVRYDFYMRVSSMPLMDTSKMETPPDWYRALY